MDQVPPELFIAPVPLVALMGMPHLHSQISQHLINEQPTIKSLSLADIDSVSEFSGKERKPMEAKLPPPVGILKSDWLLKHQKRTPAVFVVLLDRELVQGDPSQWFSVCSDVDKIKVASRNKSIKIILLFVQSSPSGDINDERFVSVRKRIEVEQRNCMIHNIGTSIDLKKSLRKVHDLCVDNLDLYYMEEGRRIKMKIERKAYSHAELTVRYHFKVAIYCEFIRDWTQALRNYEQAYDTLLEINKFPNDEAQPISNVVETKTVAEILNLKIVLLLLNGAREGEAIQALKRHIRSYLTRIGPKASQFLHWEWMGRQYRLFAELLEQRLNLGLTISKPKGLVLAERECNPGLYFQFAAEHMSKWRMYYENTLQDLLFSSVTTGDPDEIKDPLANLSPGSILPPLYIGQFPRLVHRGTSLHDQRPTEREFLTHELMKYKQDSSSPSSPSTPSHRVIELWVRAQEHHKRIRSFRCSFRVSYEIAKQYFHSGDYFAAKQHLDSCIHVFRKEKWFYLLHACLSYLRLCCKELGLFKEYVHYSLELVSLPLSTTLESVGKTRSLGKENVNGKEENLLVMVNGKDEQKDGIISTREERLGIPRVKSELIYVSNVLDIEKKKQIFHEVWKLLLGEISFISEKAAQELNVSRENPFVLQINPSNPLHFSLQAFAAFREKRVRSKQKTRVFLSLLTNLPCPISVQRIQLFFDDASLNDCVVLISEEQRKSGMGAQDIKENHFNDPSGNEILILPYKWNRFSLDVIPVQSGRRLEFTSVLVQVSDCFSIRCAAEAFPPPDYLSERTSDAWEVTHGNPFSELFLNTNDQNFIEVEKEVAMIDISLKSPKIVIVGEIIPLLISVESKGHCITEGIIQLSISSLHSSTTFLESKGEIVNDPSFEEGKEAISHGDGGHGIHVLMMKEGKPTRFESIQNGSDVERIQEERNERNSVELSLKMPFVESYGEWEKELYLQFDSPSTIFASASVSYFHDASLIKQIEEDLELEKESAQKEEMKSPATNDNSLSKEPSGIHRETLKGKEEGTENESFNSLSSSKLQLEKKISILCEDNFKVRFSCSPGFREDCLVQSFDKAIQISPKEDEFPPDKSSPNPLPILPCKKKSLLSVTISSLSSIPVRLFSLDLILKDEKLCSIGPIHPHYFSEIKEVDPKNGELVDMSFLRKGETITFLYFLLPLSPRSILEIGKLQIGWNRVCIEKSKESERIESTRTTTLADSSRHINSKDTDAPDELHFTGSSFPLSSLVEFDIPPVRVQPTTLFAKLVLPPHATLGIQFQLQIVIFNESAELEEISFTVSDSPGFVFCGSRSGSTFVLPRMSQSLTFHVVPISSGELKLPLATLRSARHDAVLSYSSSNSSIFVYPTPTDETFGGGGTFT